MQHHNDTIIKTHKDFFNIILFLTLLQGFKKGYSRFECERELETKHNWNILTPNLWPSTLCLSCSPDAQPEAQRPTLLGDGFLYCILSVSSPDLNSSGPQGPFGLMWLSLPHLVYNSVSNCHWNLNSTKLQLGLELAWLLSYIIVQRPLDCPLDLWNRMFSRHQAEITVIQFRGHSLPVHQSMRVSWEFFTSSHLISQFLPTRFPLITAIRMCHLLPVHHLGMAFLAGSKAKIQHISQAIYLLHW